MIDITEHGWVGAEPVTRNSVPASEAAGARTQPA
jgi:hypothetical protein